MHRKISTLFFILSLGIILLPTRTFGTFRSRILKPCSSSASNLKDGQHDFDFNIGMWKTHLSLLLQPLTGNKNWVVYVGTTFVRKVWNGRANLAELEADGPNGHIELLSLRLYNPESHLWSLNFANSKNGRLSVPSIGKFINDRGVFYDHEVINGHKIFVRFVVTNIDQDSCRFEQAFSADEGKTWEVNLIATDTRIIKESGKRFLN